MATRFARRLDRDLARGFPPSNPLWAVGKENMRNKMFKLRCSEEEIVEWREKAQASGVPVSELIRQAMSRVRSWSPANQKIQIEQIRLIARIGNNLNQLARWANTYKSATETINIIHHLRILEEAVKNISFPYRPNK